MKEALHSRRVKALLIILGGTTLLFLTFAFGIAVGYRRASFASQFDENYLRDFSVDMGPGPMNAHGIVGLVIDVATATIAVRDLSNDEAFVSVSPDTVIRKGGNTILLRDVVIGDGITVIGGPSDDGHIQARFVRIFTATSSAPMGPWTMPFMKTN